MSRTLGEAMQAASIHGWFVECWSEAGGGDVGAYASRGSEKHLGAFDDEPTLIAWLDALGREGR